MIAARSSRKGPLRVFDDSCAGKGGDGMPRYEELVKKYAKRRTENLVDTVTAGLACADHVAVDLGLMEDSAVADALTAAAPFAVIAVTEQLRVILGKKTGRAGFSDAVQRMLKTGAAMGVGALAAAAAGSAAAIPAAMGTRLLLNKYKSKSLLALRIQERTGRMKALRERRERRGSAPAENRPALMPGVHYLEK